MLTVVPDEIVEHEQPVPDNHKKILKDLIENDLHEEDDEADEDYKEMIIEEPEEDVTEIEDGDGEEDDDHSTDVDEAIEEGGDELVDDNEVKELINEIVENAESDVIPLLMQEAKVLRSGYQFGGEYRTVQMAEFVSDDDGDDDYHDEDEDDADVEEEDEEMTDDVDTDELKHVVNESETDKIPFLTKNVMALRTGKQIPSSAEIEDLASLMQNVAKT